MDRSVISGVPSAEVGLPPAVQHLVDGFDARPVWRNEPGGLTFALTRPGADAAQRYLKWAPAAVAADLGLRREAERLRWAVAWLRVPRVLDVGACPDGEWLLTEALPGRSAVDPRWVAEPARAVRALGVGLRRLHDALPVADCPWTWSRADRHRRVVEAAAAGRHPRADKPIGPDDVTLTEALALLADAPDDDLLVVCHGDACAPNTLLDNDGQVSGHVDFGGLGVGDRWADLAVATWSTAWNYGPGWDEALLEAYGVEPDERRMAYYRLLWDSAPD